MMNFVREYLNLERDRMDFDLEFSYYLIKRYPKRVELKNRKKVMSELISIIVPIYNAEQYLEKCLNSICNQTYENLEIILINDGSTDKSKVICNLFVKKDTRIILIDQENKGIPASRNVGLKIAKGSYIGFVDSDDWIDSYMYEILYKLILKNHADIIQVGYCKEYHKRSKKIKSYDTTIIGNEAVLDAFWIKGYMTFHLWDKLFKKELWEGIQMNTNCISRDDVIALYEILNKANKLVISSKVLYYYRQTSHSITRNNFSKGKMDELIYVANFKFNFANYNYQNINIKNKAIIACCKNMIELYNKSFYRKLSLKYRKNYSFVALSNYQEYFNSLEQENMVLMEKIKLKLFLFFPNICRKYERILKNIKRIFKIQIFL